ncbi:MAG: flocculation-associated PEP-CTERM protein PepA [Pseudomonadota bacterium]
MKSPVKSFYSALIGTAVVATSLFAAPAAHADQIFGFKIDLTSLGGPVINNINELNFSGSSFVRNTFPGGLGAPFTFTDNGVFSFGNKNGGLSLGLGFGQLTGDYTMGSGTGQLGSSITFDAGGQFDIYYNPVTTFGDSAANRYGAATGTKIATFRQLAGGGGAINPDGTPSANGQLQLNFVAESLRANTWFTSTGDSLAEAFTFSFVTANASQDNSNNCPSPCSTDPNLIAALGGGPNTLPNQFLVSNGAQFKLADNVVPEPGTVALLGLGLLGFGVMRRKSA